jgi:uncharacterized protein (DUF488 family)
MMAASETKEGVRKETGRSDNVETRIWTVGHSTRSAEEFKEILGTNRIEALVDIRGFPGSRRYPQFNKVELSRTLDALGIVYSHSPQLGGRRRPNPHSKNTAWKNASFRAYSDHMETEEFKQGIDKLLELAREKRTAFMCAEALWWRCHRSLIADFLKSKGYEVMHILDTRHTEAHPYTSAARVVDGQLSYEGLLAGSAEEI